MSRVDSDIRKRCTVSECALSCEENTGIVKTVKGK